MLGAVKRRIWAGDIDGGGFDAEGAEVFEEGRREKGKKGRDEETEAREAHAP